MKQLQLKRGTAARWVELNPILAAGEPGFEYDTKKLKIGDGLTAWKDLPYLHEAAVVNAQTHHAFPSVGQENIIYKAETEKKLYQWNPTELKYEELNNTESSGVLDVTLINGGSAGLD